MGQLLGRLLRPSLDWLLVFAPVALGLEWAHHLGHAWATPTWIFVTASLAVIPVAGWMGHATEHLAEHLGEGIGGLLNATFGNAAELIIAALALWAAARQPEQAETMHEIVKASLTGSIIGNALLVLGLALLLGGARHRVQSFNVTASRTSATLMTLAVVGLLIPDMFIHLAPEAQGMVQALSREVAVLLLVAYALSLLFSLHTHKHLYVGEPAAAEALTTEHHVWSVKKALSILLIATVAIGVLAEVMIGSVDEAARTFGFSDVFVGVIVVAIVGNAAEHSTAVVAAWNNRMDLSMGIAIGSSIQIALFVAPVLALLSHALGAPMNLVFTPAEIAAMGISVYLVHQISGDGQSNWLEGIMLLLVYALLAILFFHLPG
jgi:Ca2+:H+ antiporter